MAKTQQDEQREDKEQHNRETLNALIAEQVIHTLGKPNGLHRVQVRKLWENHYRVNILVGSDIASAKIANSYFVEADTGGNILESTPAITKQY